MTSRVTKTKKMPDKFEWLKPSVSRQCSKVFRYFSEHPENANETLIPLMTFVEQMERKQPTQIKGDEPILDQMLNDMSVLQARLQSCAEHSVKIPIFSKPDGYVQVRKRRLESFNIIRRNAKDHPEELNGTLLYADIMSMIWQYFCAVQDLPETYRVMAEICELAHWKNDARRRDRYNWIINQILFDYHPAEADE